MAKKHYLPGSDSELVTWLNTFNTQLAAFSALFGFTAGEMTTLNNDRLAWAYDVGLREIFKIYVQDITDHKNVLRDGPEGTVLGAFPTGPVVGAPPTLVAAGVFKRVAKLVKRIKAHPAYTNGIGEALGIVGDEQTTDTENMKPVLKLKLEGGSVEVQWKKDGADAIRIEVDRTGTGFQFLAIDTVPHYTDTAPITAPATWKYRAMYLIGDQLVGQWSAVESIVVG